MNRQHPCPHFALQIIQILAIFSDISCNYLLTDPRRMLSELKKKLLDLSEYLNRIQPVSIKNQIKMKKVHQTPRKLEMDSSNC